MALPRLRDVERLSERVVRILGHNPGPFTLQGTNTYLVGTGPERVLIDTGEGKSEWRERLQSLLEDEHARVRTIILTHWHPDHVGGVSDALELSPEADVFKYPADPATPYGSKAWKPMTDGQVFRTQSATLRAVHCPGHTADHTALMLEEEDAMFTGDAVLGHGTAVFEDLVAYLRGLNKLEKQFVGRAYPAHGSVIEDGPGKVREYLTHRREREEQILQVLDTNKRQTSGEIVGTVYRNYPKNLHAAAEGGVTQVLEKLENEGRVVREEGRWSRV
ncbi:Metallo-hydrolase/oxidoreductase [Piedraia hortae CBS 480.64]|uniref:Metallo-hydrolase/oxidoreductase n=1 Tax=Piedraia hortae CBS 480.64 TaxID=1314780 RepID=A0A6A7BSX5_9PEZI|nr:Metallo-hydrolase/oxidoreductase [Piedraia hortae CBS 480.64]